MKKLHIYHWKGIDQKGQPVIGESQATDVAALQTELMRQNIEIIHIRKKFQPNLIFKQCITAPDIVLFSHQLALMISAGIPLVQALDVCSKGQTKLAFRSLIQAIKNEIATGKTLHEAVNRYPKHFNILFCRLIKTAELSGTLGASLKKLAEYLEKTNSIRNKIRKAMYYPLTVMSVALIVAGLLLIFVTPQFEKLFQSYGSQLPLYTRIVISLSNLIKNAWYLVVTSLAFLAWLLQHYRKKSLRFQCYIDYLVLKLPIFGSLVQKTIIARFARTLSTTLAAGIPILDALNAVVDISPNKIYSQSIIKIHEAVASGQTLHSSMSRNKIFPSMVIQMVTVGEESGAIEHMLSKVADYYEEEVDVTVNALSTLIEPIIIVLLSIIIGSFVIAMYLPIFKLGSAIS